MMNIRESGMTYYGHLPKYKSTPPAEEREQCHGKEACQHRHLYRVGYQLSVTVRIQSAMREFGNDRERSSSSRFFEGEAEGGRRVTCDHRTFECLRIKLVQEFSFSLLLVECECFLVYTFSPRQL